MKFLLLASFVILCTASTVYRNRNIQVSDDGNILITSPNGKRVVISRQVGSSGQKKIDIGISGPNIETKRIQVQDNVFEESEIGDNNTPWSSIEGVGEEYRLKRGSGRVRSQGDLLSEILKDYQGVVDELQYEKLMNRINKAVKKGEINPQVYDLLEELDQQQQQQQQRIGVQRDVVLGQDVQDVQKQTLFGGIPIGVQRVNRDAILSLPGGQAPVLLTTQDPVERYAYTLGGQYLTTPHVNPLLQKYLPTQRSFINDLLAGQQLGGVPVLSTLDNQIVQQGVLSGGVLGTNPVLRQLLRTQQVPYGQPIVTDVRGVPQVYGVRQTVGQLRGIPQTILQQQQQQELQEQQIELQEVEQVVEQLEQLQQQQYLQQQQQQVGVQQTIRAIERLNEIQQEEEQQIVDLVEEVSDIEQETGDQLTGLRQPTIQQLYKQQHPVVQQLYRQQPVQQLYRQTPIVQQLYRQQQPISQQLYRQQQPIVGQWYKQQQPIVGQLYGQQQPIVGQLYGQQQPIVGQLYGQQQPIVRQLYGQQQPILGQFYGQQQSILGQLYGQQQPTVGQLYRQQQQQQLYGRQPIVQQSLLQQQQPFIQQLYRQQQQQPISLTTRQQITGQLRSVPLTLQQLTGIPQSVNQVRGVGVVGQPIYRGLGGRTLQSIPVQATTTGLLNTVPQAQLVY